MGCDTSDAHHDFNTPRDLCAKEPDDYSKLLQKSIDITEGRKNDKGKLRYDLIPPYPLQELVNVYTIGAKKYDDRNWEKGIRWGRVFAAMMRHAWKWWKGEVHDPEDGQHHLASVVWCAFALMEFEMTHPEMDDRNKK